MTIDEASFMITRQLMQIAESEGRMPCIVGVHSIVSIGDGLASLWLDLDDPNANEGTGVMMCHVDECAVSSMAHDILRALIVLPALTSDDRTIH